MTEDPTNSNSQSEQEETKPVGDIERAGYEFQIQSLMKELSEKNRELETFVYTVSHDLKSPLLTIDGFAGALKDDYSHILDEDALQYLSRISSAVEKMRDLINSLLEYSRIGRVTEEKHEHDFKTIVDSALDTFSDQIEKRGIKISMENEPTQICGERKRLIQLFETLIGNAVKYMNEDNPVPEIKIGHSTTAGAKLYFVSDNGPGIAPEHHDRIFRMFERAAPSTQKKEGAGVSLAIAKRIVETHNGKIKVTSTPNAGAKFSFTINQI